MEPTIKIIWREFPKGFAFFKHLLTVKNNTSEYFKFVGHDGKEIYLHSDCMNGNSELLGKQSVDILKTVYG